jgi:hypothetical protein
MKKETVAWVVYLMTIHKQADRFVAVCEQSEWDAMELARPGYHHLIREGIATEVEAETLARCHRTGGTPVAIQG